LIVFYSNSYKEQKLFAIMSLTDYYESLDIERSQKSTAEEQGRDDNSNFLYGLVYRSLVSSGLELDTEAIRNSPSSLIVTLDSPDFD
jgi:hypothetical protein